MFDGKKYYNFSNLMTDISGILKASEIKNMDIQWFWDYYGNDIDDTIQGELALNYYFEISLISEIL